jgi:hypothetical protein
LDPPLTFVVPDDSATVQSLSPQFPRGAVI